MKNEQKEIKKWYSSWFDTKYYHILYKNRNDEEAQLFMKHLTNYLNLPENGTILDLACGKGRHSVFLNEIDYTVTGVDLSENSITHAKQFENENLKFEVHDMRAPFAQQFDAIFNLFTSFGYFEDEQDNLDTLKSIQNSLNETGFGVIDFMNVNYVIDNLVPQETKTVDAITFHIKRFVKDGFINKEINFTDAGEQFSYTERVRVLTLQDFERYFETIGITLLDVFGDFKLGKFYKNTSNRLIMIFK